MNLRMPATLALVCFVIVGCSGNDASNVENNTATIVVNGEGGSLGLAGATVTVPPDAVDEPMQVTLSITGSAPAELPAGRRFLGPIYMLTPHGQVFKKAVTLTFPREEGSNELWSLEDPQDELWALEAHVELGTDHATLHTTHFSYFAWLALSKDAQVSDSQVEDADVIEDAGSNEDATISGDANLPDTGFDAAD